MELTVEEWIEIIESMEGNNSAETLDSLYSYIMKNYEFTTEGAENAFVYFGKVSEDTAAWQVVNGIKNDSSCVWVNSSNAGKLYE